MRWTLCLLAACARRVPADRLPEAPPPLAAADYVTEPLGAGSDYQRMVIANLQLGATADGLAVESDDRLSRVASRVAWEFVASGRLPSSATLQQLAADAGAPYVVPLVAVDVLPRGERIGNDLYAALGRKVPGDALPLTVGVGAWEHEDTTVVAVLLLRRGYQLSGPVAREGAAVVPLVGGFDSPAFGLLAVDADGVHLTTVPAGDGRTASPAVPVHDGWVEVLAVDGTRPASVSRSTTLGLLRLGEPAPLPEPDPGASGAAAVASGVERLRAAWSLSALRALAGEPACDIVPDEVGGIEVTRTQRCVTVPVRGGEEPWAALVQRPLALRALADPAAGLLQVDVDADGGLVTVRTLRPFVRLSSDEATARLAAAIEARWPGIRRLPESPFPDLARGWARSADPSLADGELGLRADEVAARWVGEGEWMRVLSASQDLGELLDAARSDAAPVAYALGVTLGAGPSGEPMYYAAVGFRL